MVVVCKAVPDEPADADAAGADELPELLEPPVDELPHAAVTSATAAIPAGTPHLICIVNPHSKRSPFAPAVATGAG